MPQAILLADHENLGAKGTVVDVSKGYLRNYLIPRKLAAPATKGSIEQAKRRAVAAERAVADATAKAEESAALLNKTVLTIPHQAGEDGRQNKPGDESDTPALVLAAQIQQAAKDAADARDPAGRQHQQHGGKPDQAAADRGRYGSEVGHDISIG